MIDVHVLTHSGTKPEWLDQCLQSLAAEPCTVHVVPGVEDNIAAGREIGFAQGTHPYLTFVDSDDYVLPGAMEAMCGALQHHEAAVGMEQQLTDGALSRPIGGHHLFAIRREALRPFLDGWGERNRNHHCVEALSRIAKPIHVKAVTYVWRRHPLQSHPRVNNNWRV